MSKKTGDRIHPEHELVLMMQADPFFCSACRQVGIGSAYGCTSCLVLVHRKCMYPPSTVAHPLQKNCSLKYNPQAETNGACTYCHACSKPLRGGTYSSAASGNPSFHPSCLHLEKCIKFNDVELNLVQS
ncbi:Dof-type domain-containing protein, partial [Psidium guajava]